MEFFATARLVTSPDVLRALHHQPDRHDPDFIESIEMFVEDWRAGLERPRLPGRRVV